MDESTLIVIDEAGLVPTRQMDATLQIAERHGSRVVLSGDVQQLKAIEAGRPFAQLQANGMQTAIVDQIQRQRDAGSEAGRRSLPPKEKSRESLARIDRHVRERAGRQGAVHGDRARVRGDGGTAAGAHVDRVGYECGAAGTQYAHPPGARHRGHTAGNLRRCRART